ncbi:hypothetical protein ACQPZP_30035 [Spirillospora sp. CA-142024]|uniref:hypothetical protein n=1 Tax=Spirillospora sp. CA-142024 TaxID=3240036 RepID=UPI003D90AFE2
MPSQSAPPLNEDFRLVEALQAQQPGAVGLVYNVYGAELAEYARELLGDHERAVEAVQEALLSLRDADALEAGTFRDRLYELVRDRCRTAPPRGRLVVIGGAAAAVALTGGMLALFESTDLEPKPSAAPPVAMTTPASPSPTATPTPSPPKKEEKKPAPKPEKAAPEKTHKVPDGPGRLSVDDGGCLGVRAVGLPARCYIRLTAVGGTVRWSVSSVQDRAGRVSAAGGGTLAGGRSESLPVTVHPTVLCFIGGRGGGTVSFEPGGTATVSFTCRHR